MLIFKYESEEEMNLILAECIAEGYTLVAISNLVDGNFLGFLRCSDFCGVGAK